MSFVSHTSNGNNVRHDVLPLNTATLCGASWYLF